MQKHRAHVNASSAATVLLTIGFMATGLAGEAAPSKGSNSGKGYSWADVAKWPDFTTGYWEGAGGGVANPGGLGGGARNSGAAPASAGPAGAPGGGARGGARGGGPGGNIPFTDEFQARMQKERGSRGVGVGSCEPMGVIANSGSAFYFSKDVIVIGGLADWYNVWRRVYMDGRGHPEDVEPSYFGHSIGHWEGNTLVVDTVAIRAEAQINQGLTVGNYDTRVVERFKLTGPDTIELTKTVTNAEVLKSPYTTIRTMKRTKTEYLEAFCWQDREGTAEVNLQL